MIRKHYLSKNILERANPIWLDPTCNPLGAQRGFATQAPSAVARLCRQRIVVPCTTLRLTLCIPLNLAGFSSPCPPSRPPPLAGLPGRAEHALRSAWQPRHPLSLPQPVGAEKIFRSCGAGDIFGPGHRSIPAHSFPVTCRKGSPAEDVATSFPSRGAGAQCCSLPLAR